MRIIFSSMSLHVILMMLTQSIVPRLFYYANEFLITKMKKKKIVHFITC